jgi:hypothetical protein
MGWNRERVREGRVSDERKLDSVERLAKKWVTIESEPRGGDGPFGWGGDAYHVSFGNFVAETLLDKTRANGIAKFIRKQLRAALTEMWDLSRREALREAAKVIFESNEYNHDVHSRREQAEVLLRLAVEEGTK